MFILKVNAPKCLNKVCGKTRRQRAKSEHIGHCSHISDLACTHYRTRWLGHIIQTINKIVYLAY